MNSDRALSAGSRADVSSRMSRTELRAGLSLAGVFALRMLGLFFILPVFAIDAPRLAGGDDMTLVGVALGAYGLSQGLLQIPFGMASDRWGRKPVLYAGLALFAIGSFMGATATTIWMAIAARTLQGAGAISSVAMALAADLTREQHRTKIMAMIGSTIGLMFALSLVAAPLLHRAIGLAGIFSLTGVLCLVAMWVVRVLVPDVPAKPRAPRVPGSLHRALLDPELLRLNLGIFVLHIVLYAMFLVIPPLLVSAGLPLAGHWKLYLPVILLSFLVMVPPIMFADRRNRPKPVLVGAVVLLLAVESALAALDLTVAGFALAMLGFFIAFNVLEAMLPSLISRAAPENGRGTAIGVYNTTQTLGVFFGGLLGGWLASTGGSPAVFMTCAGLSALWLLVVIGMKSSFRSVNAPAALTLSIGTKVDETTLREGLTRIRGVLEAEVLPRERIVRLRVESGNWDEAAVQKLIQGEA